MNLWRAFVSLSVWARVVCLACGYAIDTSQTSLTMIDSRTGIVAHTLFLEEATDAIVKGLLWKDMIPGNETEILNYRTIVDGKQVYQGFILLPQDPAELPASIRAGPIYVKSRGKTIIEVQFWVGDTMDSVSIQIQAFQKWIASIPIMVMCGLGFVRGFHILYTLFIVLFIGGCMVTGSFIDGFKSIITRYLINVASDAHHVYIYTFTLCVAGLVAMIRRSGGITAIAKRVSLFSNSIRLGQIIVLLGGMVLFFDPYASIIFVSEFFSPFIRFFPASLEKYAFLIHSTGVPVSAINPLSTWVGFSSALIQSQIDKLVTMGYDDLTIPYDGWSVFMRSIKYQFYPIFLLCMVVMLVLSRRDLGPMLVAERERWLLIKVGEAPKWTLREKITRPDEDTPRRVRNMLVPTVLWSVSIWTAFALVSDPDEEDNATNFTAALIYCTIGVALLTQIFYFVQTKNATNFTGEEEIENAESCQDEGSLKLSSQETRSVRKQNGLTEKNTYLSADFILRNLLFADAPSISEGDKVQQSVTVRSRNDDAWTLNNEVERRALVTLKDGAQCFFKGGATVTPVLMTLTLAWATTEVLLELGMDRLFADLINRGHLKLEMYPTIGFFISFLVALSTGSFVSAQAIVLPLLCIPLYVESGGNEDLFYALVGAVLSGSVLGDHTSPISTSTILSTFMIECDLRNHISTQTPYVIVVAVVSVMAGHLPSGFDRFPYYASYVMGVLLLGAFVCFLCQDVLNKDGKYDIITETYFSERESLRDLKIRICTVNAEEASKNADVVHDTDSASEVPSSDHEDMRVQDAIELEIEHDSDDSDEYDSSASSTIYSERKGRATSLSRIRRYASGMIRSRSRSRSRSRRPRGRYSVAESTGSSHDLEIDGTDQHRHAGNKPSSHRSQHYSSTVLNNGLKDSRRAATKSPRRVIDDEEVGSSDGSGPATGASENDTDSSGADDYTTDCETRSNATGMRTRVMKWLDQTIDDEDEDDESYVPGRTTKRRGRSQIRNAQYNERKAAYRR